MKNRFQTLAEEGNETPEDITEEYNQFTNTVLETAKCIATNEKSEKRINKLSSRTRNLMQQRRDFKIENLSDRNKVEYTELCKLVRREIRNDVRKYNTKVVKRFTEMNKG